MEPSRARVAPASLRHPAQGSALFYWNIAFARTLSV
jgi:hypothetical protein